MKREPSALLAWLLLACASAAVAGLVVTETPGKHELRERDGSIVNKYDTHEQCIAAASVAPGQHRCVNAVLVTVVGTCDDVPKPPADVYTASPDPTPAVYATPGWNEGVSDKFTDVGTLEGHLCPDGLSYSFTQTALVAAPYPACWQEQPVAISTCSMPETSP